MKSKVLVLILMILLLISCNDDSKFENCINKLIVELIDEHKYDYLDFASSFENYLVQNNHIKDVSLNEYLKFYKNQEYQHINIDQLSAEIDIGLSTFPSFNTGCWQCMELLETKYSFEVSEFVGDPKGHVISLLEKIDSHEFTDLKNRIPFINLAINFIENPDL